MVIYLLINYLSVIVLVLIFFGVVNCIVNVLFIVFLIFYDLVVVEGSEIVDFVELLV